MKFNESAADVVQRVFDIGVYVKPDIIQPIYHADITPVGGDRQMIIGYDVNGFYFYVTGPFRCYLNSEGITWSFNKEDLTK